MNFEPQYQYRTGIGTDIHRLVPDRPLVLAGVEVPYPRGLAGHSDGDVVIHAVIDALLGAMVMGDIGTLFPDTDEQYKGADSTELLHIVGQYLEDREWQVVNLDVIVHAEEPKLVAFKGQMKRSLASVLGIDFNNVNVKAKTNEGLDAVGSGQAIAATANVLIRKRMKRTL